MIDMFFDSKRLNVHFFLAPQPRGWESREPHKWEEDAYKVGKRTRKYEEITYVGRDIHTRGKSGMPRDR